MAVPRLPKLYRSKQEVAKAAQDPAGRLRTLFGTTGALDARGPAPEEIAPEGSGILSSLTANPAFLQKQFPNISPQLVQLAMLAPNLFGLKGSTIEPTNPFMRDTLPALPPVSEATGGVPRGSIGPMTNNARVPGGTPNVQPPREPPTLDVGPMFSGLRGNPTLPSPPPSMPSKFPVLEPQPIDQIAHAAANFNSSLPSASSYGRPQLPRGPLPDTSLPPNWVTQMSPSPIRPPMTQAAGFPWKEAGAGLATGAGVLAGGMAAKGILNKRATPDPIKISETAAKLAPGEGVSASPLMSRQPFDFAADNGAKFDFLGSNGGKLVKPRPKKKAAPVIGEQDDLSKPDPDAMAQKARRGGTLPQVDPSLLKMMLGI